MLSSAAHESAPATSAMNARENTVIGNRNAETKRGRMPRACVTSMTASVLAILRDDIHIINEAGRPQCCRAEYDQQVRMVEPFRMGHTQPQSMPHSHIVDFPAVLRKIGAAARLEIRVIGTAFSDFVGDGAQCPVQPRRFGTLGCR